MVVAVVVVVVVCRSVSARTVPRGTNATDRCGTVGLDGRGSDHSSRSECRVELANRVVAEQGSIDHRAVDEACRAADCIIAEQSAVDDRAVLEAGRAIERDGVVAYGRWGVPNHDMPRRLGRTEQAGQCRYVHRKSHFVGPFGDRLALPRSSSFL